MNNPYIYGHRGDDLRYGIGTTKRQTGRGGVRVGRQLELLRNARTSIDPDTPRRVSLGGFHCYYYGGP